MRSFLLFSSLAAFAAAAPQAIDYAAIDAAADPTTGPGVVSGYDAASAISVVMAAVTANPIMENVARNVPVLRKRAAAEIIADTPGYTSPLLLHTAINAPLYNGTDTYMGYKLFNNGTPFDTRLCAAACTAQSNYNRQHPPKGAPARTCQFFNTFELWKGNIYQGQYCSLYTQAWNESYATNYPAQGYSITNSYSSKNATDDGNTPLPLTSLVGQGDFESQSWGSWTQASGSTGSSFGVDASGESGYGGYIHVPAAGGPGSMYLAYPSRYLTLQANTQYRFTMDVKRDSASCGIRLWVMNDNSGANVAGIISISGTSDNPVGTWSTLSATFIATPGAYLYLMVDCYQVDSTVHFDNFILRQESTTVYTLDAPTIGPNLVADPGMESGNPSAYQAYLYQSTYTVQANAGTNSSYGMVISLQADSYADIFQTLPPVTKDKVYRVSFDAMFSQALPPSCTLIANLLLGGLFDANIHVSSSSQNAAGATWHNFGGVMVAAATGSEVFLQVNCGSPSPAFNIYIDNISVVALSA